MLFDRQRQLLALLDAFGGAVEDRDLHHLVALYGRPYDFVPQPFGAFSFTAAADRLTLIARGFLIDRRGWHLTDAGRAASARDLLMIEFAQRTGQRGEALAAEVRAKLKRVVTSATLATIGYEGKSLERYLNDLTGASITLLCDVRRNPLSRKYGFSKTTLANGCEAVGLRYTHLPELGIASEERRDVKSQADRDALFATYTRGLQTRRETIAKIIHGIEEGERVALTCFELLPEDCHRHCLAELLERELGCTATHL
ncbi:MAG: DUF488 domain-containing protein [Kofleriaceae bacterium]